MKNSKTPLLLCLILFSSFLFVTAAQAASGIVRVNKTAVREKPTTKSEVLLRLNKGDRVTVVRSVGKWLQVKVALDKSFTFDGFIFSKLVRWKKPRTAKKVVRKPTPKPRSRDLDQFFSETPKKKKRTAKTTRRQPPRRARRPFRTSTMPPPLDEDKMGASVGMGYILYNYSLSQGGATPGEVFAYNLSGISVDVNFYYRFLAAMDGKLRVGADLAYQHGIFKTTTNLLNSSGQQFGDQSSLSQSMQFEARIPVRYHFGTSFLQSVGLDVGARYYKFIADDLSSNTGDAGLYVGQQWITILGGLNARLGFPRLESLAIDLGVDVLFLNFFSESPADTSGTDSSAKMGFLPTLDIHWGFGNRSGISLKYSLWLQEVGFSGAANRVGTAVADTSIKNSVHNLGLTYYFGL